MRRNRHHIRRSVGEHDARIAERDLRHVVREIANRMRHRLIFRRNPRARRVIIRPEMSGDAPSVTRFDERHERIFAVGVHNRLRLFDHRFHFQRLWRQAETGFKNFQQPNHRRDLR